MDVWMDSRVDTGYFLRTKHLAFNLDVSQYFERSSLKCFLTVLKYLKLPIIKSQIRQV